MPTELGLTGNAQKRFVQITTLLSLIDPVRGEPIAHSLDRHPHDDKQTRDRLRKKFLDSFALICSTSRQGGETASAVCLENPHPSGTIIRLARNLGVPEGLTVSLQAILDDLAAVASRGRHQRLDTYTLLTAMIQNLRWRITKRKSFEKSLS